MKHVIAAAVIAAIKAHWIEYVPIATVAAAFFIHAQAERLTNSYRKKKQREACRRELARRDRAAEKAFWERVHYDKIAF